ncbi:MAG: RAMP superfamily CRISPR-associated protein, partial [Candidatus Methanomethyliaceae archaeon]
MRWDYSANLENTDVERTGSPWALSSGFVDSITVRFLKLELELQKAEQVQNEQERRGRKQQIERQKMNLRNQYKQKAKAHIPVSLLPYVRPVFASLPSSAWLGLQVDFKLLTPWYSKDDRVFHVLDNPVRKDRVFGVPFMSAASWKGLLRWACRMQADLREHLEEDKRFEEWKDPNWILHLLGNEKGEEKYFHQGALVFYPTWFDKIGFEAINPHSRERRAGTKPIYYEVVPHGAKGTLYLLYAPWPGMKPAADPAEFLPKLLEAIETLLTTYGISAKRTVGWGT